jgi:hypothetical protein
MTSFGRYRLDRVLGRGGMGVVHAAHDTVLDREVALKIVAPHLAGDAEFRARFQHEAEVLAKLDSDRIVRIYDHGEHEGSLFIVTQLVDGGDLQRLVADSGPLSPALAVEVVCQVLEGLRDAHAVGVIHRDIKPANVLLRQRHGEVEAFLCDFGIAAAAGGGFTMTGGVAGSLPYMAPERHRGEEATPPSDVYAVGCLLWHGLTGSAPYAGTDVEVAMAHIEARVPQLPGRDEFSRRMNAVLARAMAKDRRKRYPSAKAMLADLQPLAQEAPGVLALPGATALRRPVVVRRRRWVAPVAAVAGVLAVVGTGVGVASLGGSGDPDGREALPVPATLTETVSAGDDMLLGNQVTLAPGPVRRTRSDGGVVRVPPSTGRSELPVAPTRRPAAPGAATTAPVAPAPPPPPPEPRYRCWDGSTRDHVASCGDYPRGATGARWLFPAYPGASADCGQHNNTGQTEDVERFFCWVPSSPEPIHVVFTRWTSYEAGLRFLREDVYLRGDASKPWSETGWTVDGEYSGQAFRGWYKTGKRMHCSRIYGVGGVTWSTEISWADPDLGWGPCDRFTSGARPVSEFTAVRQR